MGEKIPFALDNAVLSSRTINQGLRNLFINGISVDDMIRIGATNGILIGSKRKF